MLRFIGLLALVASCVKGNPDFDPTPAVEGGKLVVPGCGYEIETRLGAEAPRPGLPLAGPDPTPRQIHLSFVGDPRTSMVVQWRTADDLTLATTIRYAEGAELPVEQLTETATGITFAYEATGSEKPRMHQAHLCNLRPGTAYSYQVGSEGYFSDVYTFRTAPDVDAHPDAEVVVGVLGDSRSGYEVWAQLSEQLRARTPDLVLFTGDAVLLGITQYEWDEFYSRAEPLLARVPLISVNGNHEGNAVNFYSQLAMPGDQETFGFDYGHAHVTIANDSPTDPTTIGTAVRDAIAKDFAASATARWKLLAHHRPMWSAGMRHGSNLELQQAWQPLVDEHAIDLVLNGHEHHYEVTKPLRGQTVQATNADGTVYIVAGGAGAEPYDNGTQFFTQYSEKTHSAATLRIRRDSLVFEAFRPDGTAIATGFSKTKP